MDDTTDRRERMLKQLDHLAAEVANDQAAIDGQCDDTRKRVIRMGKHLAALQKIQKKEQEAAKERGEEPQTWKQWCDQEKVARGNFPEVVAVTRYILISRYPKAYRSGMSIKEAYKEAGKWKKNGGNPPPVEKVTIRARPLITIGAAAGKLNEKIEKLLDGDFEDMAGEQEWTTDEIDGALDELLLLKQACQCVVQKLKGLRASTLSEDSHDTN